MTDLDTEQIRDAFDADLSGYEPSPDLVARAHRGGRQRQRARRGMAFAGTGLAAAAVTASVLIAGNGASPSPRPAGRHHVPVTVAAATMRLAGKTVHLPAGYRLVSDATSSCQTWLSGITHGDVTWIMPSASSEVGTAYPGLYSLSDTVVAAPDNERGCIHSAISSPYDLPSGITPTSPIITSGNDVTPTTVDGNYAETAALTINSAGQGSSSSAMIAGTLLYVRVAEPSGQYRLVTVVGWAVPRSELLTLTAQALSPAAR